MKRKAYVYHVVYNFQQGTKTGNGSVTIYLKEKISTPQHIKDIAKYIETNYANGNVIVESWIRLKNAHVPS